MPRIEQKIMSGWEFALGRPTNEKYREVILPHDWAVNAPFNKQMEQGEAQGYRDRWGVGWYRKQLVLEEKKEGYRYYLDFGGIFENSTIWVNGQEAGGHKYGYSSFRLDVTGLVQKGGNTIEIKVDNTVSPVDRWYSGCGIYRTVKWIEVEEKHFEEKEIIVHTKIIDADAKVYIYTGIEGTVKAVLSHGEESYEEKSTDGNLVFHLDKAKLWSAEEPNLYKLNLQLLDGERIADTVTLRIGIREITMIPNQGMFVNGQKVVLKGVCIHQEVGCRGIAAKKEIWRERLIHLKEMGCNSIRTAHHIHSVELLDLCDEMGFYVYEECFDKWIGGSYGRYFETEWKKDIECMIKRDRNRACIFIWGVGNEVENQAQGSMINILKMLREHVLTMDQTRPITYAMNPHFKRESKVDVRKIKDIQQFVDEVDDTEIYDIDEKVQRIKRIADIVDVISCNYQEQWYEKIHECIPDKLILGTEIFQFFKGHFNQLQNFTNENPSLVPLERDYVIGGMIWTGYDYLGESMGYPAKGWSGAMIRTNGSRRASYYILQSYWSEKPMVHFEVMDYSLSDEGVKEHWDIPIYAEHWHFPQFHKTVIPYMIASNCDEVELYVNGKRFYVPRPQECDNRLITGFLPYLPGTVKVIGYRDGIEVCSHIINTPGPAVKLEFEQHEQHIIAEEGYEMLLTVRAKDKEGNPYFRESSLVRFRVEGDAGILGVDSGNLMSSEPYNEKFIHMYHGQASVHIRLDGKPGRIAVYADTEGMQSGMAIVNVLGEN